MFQFKFISCFLIWTNLPRTNALYFYYQSLKKLLKTAISDTQREEELVRKALDKITEIRGIRNEYRIQARNAGNTESIRRGARMQMVHSNAQTLPLFVGKPGEKSPPLCGAAPADPNYIAKVTIKYFLKIQIIGIIQIITYFDIFIKAFQAPNKTFVLM